MTSFIKEVLIDLQDKGYNFSELTFILPSKRAGVFLKKTLSELTHKTFFAPEILSIEEFVESLSGINYATNTELLFEFYDVYLKITPIDQIEPFDDFSKWAQLLLQDFNEIDRYLIPPNQIFDYLKAIKEINHWSLEENQTKYIQNYISFWSRLKEYYSLFNNQLLSKKKGYQGLVYKEAVENLEQYISIHTYKKIVFVGFNALNKSEETIIQEFLQQEIGLIYWDIDKVFIENSIHDAGLFIRKHKNNWAYFKKNNFNWVSNNYSSAKNIKILGVPKNIGQIKYIGEILETLEKKEGVINNTAIVLGDEGLLLPLLNSIPNQITNINITMGLPLSSVPLASLFNELFTLHKLKSNNYYYKDLIKILTHPFIRPLFDNSANNTINTVIDYIQTNNVVYLNLEKMKSLVLESHFDLIDLLFKSWDDNPKKAINKCLALILILKNSLNHNKQNNLLSLEYLYRFNEVFNTLQELNNTYKHIFSIKTLHGLYKDLLKNETLDFKGEPLKGLQIMGMLESRVLDFETVIIASVNEGILPAGKSTNSFIPFDVKIENELPTYKEKDAVYTYHFYRLLQRAKNVYVLYNTEPDVLIGGEKSRFINQLEIENIHSVEHPIVIPNSNTIEKKLKRISKTDAIIEKLKAVSNKGLSPSSLTNYIRNPIDFYYQKILNIKQFEEAEETVAANTLGNIIHKTLEDFYKPYINKVLSIEDIKLMLTKVEKSVTYNFKLFFKEGDLTKGKNLIIFEISKRYIQNFLQKELESIKKGDTIKILDLEKPITVNINISNIPFPIALTGNIDRIDEFNGVKRIIDYKTGQVKQGDVEIVNWGDLTTDYKKFSKSFQLLCYAYMLSLENAFNNPIEAGIISFKNLNAGFLKFALKDKNGPGAKKNQLISNETLIAFEKELKDLIKELFNQEIDFLEKEI